MKIIFVLLPIIIAVILVSCKSNPSEPQNQNVIPSFDYVQKEIFNKSCAVAGCHASTNDATYAQHGLVLEQSVSFNNLINTPTKNLEAASAGLMRVKPLHADSSLLYHKLHFGPSHHSKDYGNPMPLGGIALTNGQIEFIRRWIEAGAPQTGTVVDAKVLNDTTRYDVNFFTPLPPPAQGIQLKIEPFAVQPKFEREIFVYRRLNNPAEIYVNRLQVKMRLNSHHFLLYTFRKDIPSNIVPQYDVIRDIRNPDGSLNFSNMRPMAYHVFFAGAGTTYLDYKLPDSVALKIPANFSLDMNTHYANKTSSPINGEVYCNLFAVNLSKIKYTAGTLNLANTNLVLPPNSVTTLTKNFIADSTIRVFMLISHTHS
ncbi:MAG: hypothetical protein KJ666_06735, partial [Bacteroidetes bacterium]|nr:hypothetical protein [Bacteroidota bacterium]